MKKNFKKQIAALGLSVIMATGTIYGNVLPNTTVAATTSKKQYHVNKYGVLTTYSGSNNVTIRANVSAIEPTVFDSIQVNAFYVSDNNKYFKSIDGVLYTKNGKELIRYPSGRKGSYVIPNTVTSIAQDAFRGCSHLTSVQLPNNLTRIGTAAFYNCKKLETIHIPSKITALKKQTFYNCFSLKSISLSSNIEEIGDETFYNCRNLTSAMLPSNLIKLGQMAFYNCKALKEVFIPNKVNHIASYSFFNCKSLESIHIGANVESIGYFAFSQCSSIKTIMIPSTVDIIQGHAFENCDNLKKAVLSNQLSIIPYALFKNCAKLQTVNLPSTLNEIEDEAFKDCSSLTTIKIPKNVSKIDPSAYIGAGTTFVVDAANKNYSTQDGILYNADKTILIKYPSLKSGNYTTLNTVKRISGSAFKYCSKLKNVTISEGIKKLSKTCFYKSSVETISLPSTLKMLDNVSNTINTPNLKAITIPEENEYFTSNSGILYNKTQSKLYMYPSGKTGTITFPMDTQDLSAIEIENQASKFAVISGSALYATDDGVLTNKAKSKIYAVPGAKVSYQMGNKIKNVDTLLFSKYALTKLQKIIVNKANKYFTDKNGVLLNADKTKIIFYPNAKTGEYTTPSSVTLIKSSAFCYTTKLTALTFGKNIEQCNINLTDCSSLKTVTLKEGRLRKLNLSIEGLTAIKKVTLPSSLVSADISHSKNMDADFTIVGWTNTPAETLAKHMNAKFISVGLIPKQVKNVKIKAYVNTKRVKITWKRDYEVTGYELYADNKKLKTIKNNSITEADIYVGNHYSSVLYIRSYKIQNGKKIYRKAKKITYYPYS